jgi:hypothetical protein
VCIINGQTGASFSCLVKGSQLMSSGAQDITGITDDELEAQGALPAVAVANLLHWVWGQARECGGAVPVWIAHNGRRCAARRSAARLARGATAASSSRLARRTADAAVALTLFCP